MNYFQIILIEYQLLKNILIHIKPFYRRLLSRGSQVRILTGSH